jgi:Zn-dependent M28 family amino/carboxypeptidase
MNIADHVNPVILSTILALLVCNSGCNEDPKNGLPPFDGQRAYAEVEALVEFSPRDAGTPEGWKAAKHIHKRLTDFGVEADLDTFTDMTPEGEKTMINVVGTLPGRTKQWIILGSHFDTMPGIENFQGANDSGSSTGVLLELARMLAEADDELEVGIIFAFFDGEEGIAGYVPGDGLHGSRYMAGQLVERGDHKKITAMILLDMVGDKDLHFTIPVNSTKSLVKELLDAAHAVGNRDRFSLARRMVITDDHVPFLQAGIPAIDIIDFKFGSEPGLNDHWHTDADNLENICANSLEITGSIVLQMLKQMALVEITD